MYADDLVEWLMTIAEKSRPSCPIYNVGSDQAILIAKLAQKIGAIFGQNVLTNTLEIDYVDRYVPNVNKAFEELGLTCKYNLNESIQKTLKLIRIERY